MYCELKGSWKCINGPQSLAILSAGINVNGQVTSGV